MSEPARKRWDRAPEQGTPQSNGVRLQPPFPGVMSDVIWIVSRLAADRIRPFVPAELSPATDLIGVLGIYEVPTGSPLSPFGRAFGGVTLQGHQSPDSRDAVYIIGDIVNEGAADTWREHYVDTCLGGEPRVWWEDELLHGAVSSGGKEWMHAVLRPSGEPQDGVTGQDAYLGRTRRGLSRHVVSYYGAVAPCEVLSLEIAESAPVAFAALKPSEMLLGLRSAGLHTTWSESRALSSEEVRRSNAGDGGEHDLAALLRAIGLTPAESRLAVLFGGGLTARESAQQLGITEHTAKSTLKQVYGKLGVRKQSELGRFIARLH
jgi:DNA-binding CsgD family transcriptional regulator